MKETGFSRKKRRESRGKEGILLHPSTTKPDMDETGEYKGNLQDSRNLLRFLARRIEPLLQPEFSSVDSKGIPTNSYGRKRRVLG
ncbi:MAG: hypothetical protein QXF66_00295 [Candidatus Hadarchaeales archaeon]